MSGALVHTGQVVLDLVLRVRGLPPVGGDVFASRSQLLPGGGFNVMAAATRAGARVVYAGGHGVGHFGDVARAALAAEGIAVAAPVTLGIDTGICVVMVDDTGERTFVTGSGAEETTDAAVLADVAMGPADVVYVTGYSLLDAKAEILLERLEKVTDATVLVDPGPLAAEIDPGTWTRLRAITTVLSCNAREARLLTGATDLRVAAAALATTLPAGATVIVRDGPAGCLLTRDGTTVTVPGFAVTAVDTNGAGDAHCGVLAAELLRGVPLAEAALRANAAAAIAVTREGPATAPTRAEVDALLQR
ncbi:PfkB family carbohydrate kinase [Pseudonocardia sp. GCM10023141]|uniref:PfkB family carbohydrate kinase n=1 Tax=Pseudonocardia sp. GCM10023141 TaxID=3252653 RepID=UPI00360C9F6A